MLNLKSVDHVSQMSGEERSAKPVKGTTGNSGSLSASSSDRAHLAIGKSATPFVPGLETVLGKIDRRQRITQTGLYPWRMICQLTINRAHQPKRPLIGTGWFIGPRTLLTAGHCVYHEAELQGWASSIEITPGRNGDVCDFGSVTALRYSCLDVWQTSQDPDFDIGCIHLDEPLGEKTGWFATASPTEQELTDWNVNLSGYPADRPAFGEGDGSIAPGTAQYHHRNRVLRVSSRRLFYDVDSYGGQSGSPVWIQTDADADPIAVGVHAYGEGGTPWSFGIKANSAPRLIPEVMDIVHTWIESGGPSA